MSTFTVGPEEGKVYSSKKGYPAKADRSIDNITTQVHIYHNYIHVPYQLCIEGMIHVQYVYVFHTLSVY